jgi:hypothetical protein
VLKVGPQHQLKTPQRGGEVDRDGDTVRRDRSRPLAAGRRGLVAEPAHLRGVGDRAQPTKHVGECGEKLFQAADHLGLEGVIGKKVDSPNLGGRTTNWVKVKTAHGRHIDENRAK